MKCVMCGDVDEFVNEQEGLRYIVYFLAPQTKEPLCEKCNLINNGIAKDKEDFRLGKKVVVKI